MATNNDVILQMNHIVKRFGPVTALKDVNITVKRGQIFSICGENGAGKSTLMNVLSGVYPYGTYEAISSTTARPANSRPFAIPKARVS